MQVEFVSKKRRREDDQASDLDSGRSSKKRKINNGKGLPTSDAKIDDSPAINL